MITTNGRRSMVGSARHAAAERLALALADAAEAARDLGIRRRRADARSGNRDDRPYVDRRRGDRPRRSVGRPST